MALFPALHMAEALQSTDHATWHLTPCVNPASQETMDILNLRSTDSHMAHCKTDTMVHKTPTEQEELFQIHMFLVVPNFPVRGRRSIQLEKPTARIFSSDWCFPGYAGSILRRLLQKLCICGTFQTNVRNPDHHYFSKSTAIDLHLVLLYTSNLYCSAFGAPEPFSSPPICIAVRLPPI